MPSLLPRSPGWRLSAWYFFYFAYIGAFAPYFTLYLQSLGLSAAEIATLMSVMLAMRLIAPNLWGWLADHLGHKTAILRAAAVLSALGFALFFWARGFWALFAAMALMAFFWSAALPLVEALTLRHLEHRLDRYGRIRLWGSIGFIAAVLGTGGWLDRAPLESLLWINLGLLSGVVLCAWSLPESMAGAVASGGSLAGVLRRREVIALLAACFFMSAAHSPFYVFYSIHLVDHGYGKTEIGMLWSLGVVAEILAFIWMPRLMGRFSLAHILAGCFALAVLRFLLIGWLVDVVPAILAAQLMHGATFGIYHAAAVAALGRWFPPGQQARAQALYGSISFGAGGMAGNLASGPAWDWIGAGWTFTSGSMFAAVGLLLVWAGMSRTSPDRR